MGTGMKEKLKDLIVTSIGISNIPISDFKRFKEFAVREADDNYAKALGMLLDFYELGATKTLREHEERLSNLEGQDKNEKPTIKRFGGNNE